MEFLIDPFLDSERYFATQLQQYQFFDKYSRFDYSKGRRETWKETVNRAVDYLRWVSDNKLDKQDYNDIYNAILNMEVMPSMRLLAMAGDAAKKMPQSIYNCSFLGIDSIQSLVEVLNISMNGVGIGFSVEDYYVSQLSYIKEKNDVHSVFIISDSTAGWCKAFEVGLTAWFNGEDVVFDYSQIRDAGSPLKTKGGRSSGPEPLKKLLDFARQVIMRNAGMQLSSLDVYDIVCKLADCVVSGGVRRVAMLCLFDNDDELMLDAKNSNIINNPHRYNANNSTVLPERELTQKEVLNYLMQMDKDGNGEPGIFSRYAAKNTIPKRRSYTRFGLNPCQPGFATVRTHSGITTFDNIDVGSVIWSGKQWTKVVKKIKTGIKKVYQYTTYDGVFVGTDNHRVVTRNGKIEVDKAYVDDLGVLYDCENNKFSPIIKRDFIGEFEVYDITVDCSDHTYCTGGLIVSNCGEVFLRHKQFCNLSSVICREDDTLDSLERKVKIATIIGTIQSMVTNFRGLSKEWQNNCEQERLLGVDLNGQMDCDYVRKDYNQEYLQMVSLATNIEYANKLGVEISRAITTVKPSGNSGVLLDVSSGIHPRWSKYYIRNVRVSKTSPLYSVLLDSGVNLSPENGQNAENATSYVVSFPMKSPDNAITRHDITALEQLGYWKQVKLCWTDHNPSMTCYYNDNEILDIANWIYKNQKIIGGLAFLPKFDVSYPQAPYIEITKDEYEKLLAEFPKIDFSLLQQYEDEDLTEAAQEVACSAGMCDLQL